MFYFLELVQIGKDACTPLTIMLCTNDSLRATGRSANPQFSCCICGSHNQEPQHLFFQFFFPVFTNRTLTEMVSNQIVDY